jgi:hypothetical protein
MCNIRIRATLAGLLLGALVPLTLGVSIAAAKRLITPGKYPPPPAKEGCYSFEAEAWHQTECETPAEQPPPEDLDGVETGPPGSPLVQGQLVVAPLDDQFASDVDNKFGPGAYSIQLNTNGITGNNGEADWMQFVDQVSNAGEGMALHHICLWQIDTHTKQYYTYLRCKQIMLSAREPGDIDITAGTENGMLYLGWAAFGSITPLHLVAVVSPDAYGLGDDGRWRAVSGLVVGYGGSSRATFADAEDEIGVQASTCPAYGGLWDFLVKRKECSRYPALEPYAFGAFGTTGESSNLEPVIGNPPTVLPKVAYYNKWLADIGYIAASGGKCLNGKPPNCR